MFMCIASVCSLGTLCVKHGCDKTLVLLTRYLQITAGKMNMYTSQRFLSTRLKSFKIRYITLRAYFLLILAKSVK